MCFRSPFSLYKCGHCFECLQERRRDWSLRLQWDSEHVSRPYIFHLTYSNDNLRYSKSGKPTLCKKDIDKFFKRLRHVFSQNKLSYFLCGEYSPKKLRPHYHCCIFGIPQTFDGVSEIDTQNYINKKIQKTWGLGFCLNRSCFCKSTAQIHYVTKYMLNGFNWSDDDDREKPFNFISQNIGLSYVDYAIKHNIYLPDIQDYFECSYREILNNKGEIKKIYLQPIHTSLYEFDVDSGEYDWNPLLVNFPDRYECIQINNRTGLPEHKTYPLPRYWRVRLLTPSMRHCLEIYHSIESRKKFNNYISQYGEYDLHSEVPMWLQLKRLKFDRFKKSKKDKELKDPSSIDNFFD